VGGRFAEIERVSERALGGFGGRRAACVHQRERPLRPDRLADPRNLAQPDAVIDPVRGVTAAAT
jgi:hypothetical protein